MQRFAKGDRNAQQEISKQAQKAHDDEQALRRAIQGKAGNSGFCCNPKKDDQVRTSTSVMIIYVCYNSIYASINLSIIDLSV